MQHRPPRPPRAGDWYRITNLADTAEVVIYDEIGWWGTTAEQFMRDLKDITASQITLRINSPGGDVFDGIAIHNLLRAHTAHVTTHVDGLAASIASVIALAGDRVVMEPHSQMMIHDASGFCYGQAADMREMADMLDRHSDNIAGVYAERAGGTVAEWRERMRGEAWFSADEAVAAGLADEVGQRRDTDDDQPVTNSWDLAERFRYPGRAAAPAPVLAVQTPPAEPAAGPAITDQEEDSMSTLSEGLRERLGIDADAELDDTALLDALDEALAERADTTPPEPAPAPAPEPIAARIPEGMTLIDSAALDELRNSAAEGVAARAQQRAEERDRVLNEALRDGKFPPARREHYAKAWDRDPDGTRALLDLLPKNSVPVEDIGEPGTDPLASDAENAAIDRLFSIPGKDA
ncbi:ATP-dependent Clp protease proteolytic subunit [Actinomadura sp. ATCC 31491]|uniref:ATP-dependent Clp protease proteolytic subunit n=1 Tax=Actinomadura luzonensis TaxID=2805427 RepID=A0ABT0G6H5_9ACTN|nr:head maturation protease, ClpP-related [Actinomadura luzonensis]MCK2219703.1 ATP-dependent Clp protease proteolytic subunit [Actinomadura luzonensis]